jgi:hypothetical protein
MLNEPRTIRICRRLLPYATGGVAVALLYVIWVFAARSSENRRIEHEAAAREAQAAKEVTEIYGGSQLRIVSFYPTPGVIRRGEKALVCYGVANATTVRLDPAVERVWPSVGRCFEVAPRRTTRFTLTAEDGQGHTATQSFLLEAK